MTSALHSKIHEIEPARSVFDIVPLEEHLNDAFAENRLRTILLTFFALTAVSISLTGHLSQSYGWGVAFSVLAIGPLLGVFFMRKFNR